MPEIISRKTAIDLGLKKYFTGKPCIKGHISERYVTRHICIECNKGHRARHGQEKRHLYAAAAKRYRQRNPEKVKAYAKKWQAESKEYRKKYKEANRDRALIHAATYRERHREKVRVMVRNRAARRRRAEGTHTKEDIKRIMEAQDHKCVYCRQDITVRCHVDHIMPTKLGGSNWPSNLQCLCPSCNTRKSAKHPDVWEKEIGFVRECP